VSFGWRSLGRNHDATSEFTEIVIFPSSLFMEESEGSKEKSA